MHRFVADAVVVVIVVVVDVVVVVVAVVDNIDATFSSTPFAIT